MCSCRENITDVTTFSQTHFFTVWVETHWTNKTVVIWSVYSCSTSFAELISCSNSSSRYLRHQVELISSWRPKGLHLLTTKLSKPIKQSPINQWMNWCNHKKVKFKGEISIFDHLNNILYCYLFLLSSANYMKGPKLTIHSSLCVHSWI